MNVLDTIQNQISNNRIILYMKGTPEQPMCGFSARAVQALIACNTKFAHVDVLAHPEIRQALPAYSKWPTFPQLYIDGELIGGCDIITEMYKSGELRQLLDNIA